MFLGKTVLGDFFLENRGLRRGETLRKAHDHFDDIKNLVRPVLTSNNTDDTLGHRALYICDGSCRWALFSIYTNCRCYSRGNCAAFGNPGRRRSIRQFFCMGMGTSSKRDDATTKGILSRPRPIPTPLTGPPLVSTDFWRDAEIRLLQHLQSDQSSPRLSAAEARTYIQGPMSSATSSSCDTSRLLASRL